MLKTLYVCFSNSKTYEHIWLYNRSHSMSETCLYTFNGHVCHEGITFWNRERCNISYFCCCSSHCRWNIVKCAKRYIYLMFFTLFNFKFKKKQDPFFLYFSSTFTNCILLHIKIVFENICTEVHASFSHQEKILIWATPSMSVTLKCQCTKLTIVQYISIKIEKKQKCQIFLLI